MSRDIEEPITSETQDHLGGTRTTHPAYGQIVASRVSGHTALYDSDFIHQHYMTITIKASELHRGLNRDWHFAKKDLIEVAMSEAQWATFVSSPNMGGGVPCTIGRYEGRMIPGLPDPQKRQDQFKAELQERMANMLAGIANQIDRVDAMGLPKGKAKEIKSGLEAVLREVSANLPFVADQFSEHMETTVERAKQEVHGYMTGVLQRAGLGALTGENMPLQIEHQESNP